MVRSLRMIAFTAIAWIVSSELAAAQSRLFSCPHARVVELTVNGANRSRPVRSTASR